MATFKTKARTVDLLGQKQIKDSATAIAELFKNAHDADARTALLQIDTKRGCAIVVDSGTGMSESQVINHWLSLGGSSKTSLPNQPVRRTERYGRVMMGEKGIGRLAVSALGEQLLLVTKSVDQPFVVVYLHWGIFQNLSLNLEDVVIPVRPIDDLSMLDETLAEMKAEFCRSILSSDGSPRVEAWDKNYAELATQLVEECKGFQYNQAILRPHLDAIQKNLEGTLFFLTGLKENWERYVDRGLKTNSRIERRLEVLRRSLSSFTNPFRVAKPESFQGSGRQKYEPDPGFSTKILIDTHEVVYDQAFTVDDLRNYDLGLQGRVEAGVFHGSVLFYGKDPQPVTWNLQGGTDPEDSDCGPFQIQIYHVEGDPKNTRLPPVVYDTMKKKLDAMGGVYLYRDNLRVLPYGDPEFDFLQLEKLRTLRLAFPLSNRRIFGWIEISRVTNPGLEDKSSREGFRENKEFNYFQTVLVNLVQEWGVKYLMRLGQRESFLKELKDKREAEERRLREIERQHAERAARRERIEAALDQAYKNLAIMSEQLQIDCSLAAQGWFSLFHNPNTTYKELLDLSRELTQANTAWQNRLRDLEKLKISGDDVYRLELDGDSSLLYNVTMLHYRLNERFDELSTHISTILENARTDLDFHLSRLWERVGGQEDGSQSASILATLSDRMKLVESSLREEVAQAHREFKSLTLRRRGEYDDILKMTGDWVSKLEAQEFGNFAGHIEQMTTPTLSSLSLAAKRLSSLTLTGGSPETVQSIYASLAEAEGVTARLQSQAVNINGDTLTIPILDHLNDYLRVLSDPADLKEDYIGALERDLLSARHGMEQYRSLAGAGMAVEIVDHELRQQLALMQRVFGMTSTKQLLRQNPSLGRLRDAFDHISNRLRVLHPLLRRSAAKRETLNLYDLVEEVRELFGPYLWTGDAQSVSRKEAAVHFENRVNPDHMVEAVRSSLFSVLVNLINNAIFWVQPKPKKDRQILLYSGPGNRSLWLEDSGVGVEAERAEQIFDLRYSSRPDGRGIGLYLSRELLTEDGHSIQCLPNGPERQSRLPGACFVITFTEKLQAQGDH